ncbi:hypothetical protein THRCLA_10406 [Thraustotheca clavata]|uniref:Uncharacterized protein n=1 Tax=Thraustotheca clavata TaxID=74557 RepID=A0A1V9YQW1_9STRA|nr:hypothetical protein THRCLA_10406 [Thraustotheca clavata]
MDSGAIAGIVIGAVVLVGALTIALYLHHNRPTSFKNESLPTTLSRNGRHSYLSSPPPAAPFVPWFMKTGYRPSSMSHDQSIVSEPQPEPERDLNARDSFWERLSPTSKDQITNESMHRTSSAPRIFDTSTTSIPMIEIRQKRSESYDTASDASDFGSMHSFVSSSVAGTEEGERRSSDVLQSSRDM